MLSRPELHLAVQKTFPTSCSSGHKLDSLSGVHRPKLRVPIIALLFSLAFANAWGAISIDANVSTNTIAAGNAVSSPVFSTSAPNELLLAYIATDWSSGANTFVTNVSGGGLTWNLVRRTNAQSGSAEIWMAFSAGQLSNASVTAGLSQSAFASLTVMSYVGADPSSPIGATGSGNGNTTPSASLVTTRNNSWVFGVGNDFDRAIARVPGSGQNLVNQYLASVGDTYWVQMQSTPTPLSGTTTFISDTAPNGDRYNLSIVEILPLQTNSISGTVLPASLGFSTLLTLSQSGTNISTATADSLGAFTFPSVPNGIYAVTPAKAGVIFTPPTATITVSGTGATANFTATTPPTFTISGTITGSGGNGATVSLGGPATSTTTANSSGTYMFSGLTAGSYTVTPAQPGYTFSPPSQNVTLSGANGVANFSAIAQTWSISGTLTPAAAGVPIALTGQSSGSTLTDISGNYLFTGLPNGTYSLTPSQSGYTFTPSALSVILNGANATGINFIRQQPVSASIAIDATVSGTNPTAQNTVSTPSLTTHAVNELLLAFVAADSSTSPNTTVNSITGGGLTWAFVTRTNVQSGTAEIWRAFAPTQINNATITASLSQSVWASLTVMSYTGADPSTADGSSAIGAVASSNASSGAPSGSIITTRNNSWVFGVGNDFDKAIARTPAAGQSLVSQSLTILGDTYWVQMQNAATPAAGTTIFINDTAPTGDRFNLSLVEILPALATGSWSIGGNVSPATLAVGTTVNLSGKSSTTTLADASGNYVLPNLSDGNYSVTPTKAGVIFSPVSTAVTLNGANVGSINFLASQAPPTYTITGTITPTTVGAGATIKLIGPVSLSTSVNAAGVYSFTGVPAGIYSVTPTSTSASFAPLSQNVTVSATNLTGINFNATATENIVFYDDFTGTSLTSDWTIISRHGEYAQNETECNVPGQVNVSNGFLTITTIAKATTCGDFNPNGTVRTSPSSWPYATGDVQWSKFNFKYGTVTIRGRMPAFGTGLWPAFWLMGSNCQATNPFTGDTGIGNCPNPGANGYTEIDFPECYGGTAGNWCQFHVANPSFSMGGGCDTVYPLDTNYHIFSYNWTASKISVSIDGKPISTCNTAMTYGPMFLIMQIQTGGAGGTPNNALLPAQMGVDYVKVTQP